jgi:hypothetical protein
MHIKIELEHYDARLTAEVDTGEGDAYTDPVDRAKEVGSKALSQLVDQIVARRGLTGVYIGSHRRDLSQRFPPQLTG